MPPIRKPSTIGQIKKPVQPTLYPDPKPEGEQRPDFQLPSTITETRPTPWDPTPLPKKNTSPLSTSLASRLQPTDNTPHLECPALAGTGKTTTMIQGLVNAKGGTPTVTPSDEQRAIWDALAAGNLGTVRVSSFANGITDELKRQIEKFGLSKKGVEAKGIHGLGNWAVKRAFNITGEPTEFVVHDLIGDHMGGDARDLKRTPGKATVLNATAKLVSLCKQTMTTPDPMGLDYLTSRYDVEMGDERTGEDYQEQIYDMVPVILEKCKSPVGRISFDDMIWLPLVLDLHIPKVDTQIIDESQDLNRMQQELMYRAGRRIIFVGDEHQAIYGFAGADAESMSRMKQTLANSTKGCQSLPLTVTRRCGKAIVREANQYVPRYRAHELNPEGLVRWMKMAQQEKETLPWEKTYAPLVKPGDMVLCRANGPLVSECFSFIKRKIPANIMGRKIGEGLVSLVEKLECSTILDLIKGLEKWLERELMRENAKKHPSESKLQGIQDRYDCVQAFVREADDPGGVVKAIQEVFVDKAGQGIVRFASGHRSKGLEAHNVFILKPKFCGPPPEKLQPWELVQEQNIKYVMCTRAIYELNYVIGD